MDSVLDDIWNAVYEKHYGVISELPIDVKRSLAAIGELDQQKEDLLASLRSALATRAFPDVPALTTRIQEISAAKVNIASNIIASIERYMTRIDEDIDQSRSVIDLRRNKLLRDKEAPPKVSKSSKTTENTNTIKLKIKSAAKESVSKVVTLPPVEPDEPLYCFCHQPSYGDMVACDNDDCKYQWFHFRCVGLKSSPKGKWYCRECKALLKK